MSSKGEREGATIRRKLPDSGMRKGGVVEELDGSDTWYRHGDYCGWQGTGG
jgi:hypothetical protein